MGLYQCVVVTLFWWSGWPGTCSGWDWVWSRCISPSQWQCTGEAESTAAQWLDIVVKKRKYSPIRRNVKQINPFLKQEWISVRLLHALDPDWYCTKLRTRREFDTYLSLPRRLGRAFWASCLALRWVCLTLVFSSCCLSEAFMERSWKSCCRCSVCCLLASRCCS